MKQAKRALTLTLVLLMVLQIFGISASAITVTDIPEFRGNSTFTPVNYKDHKATSTVYLYGNADYLCMRAKADTDRVDGFYVAVFSDAKMKNAIMSFGSTYKKGTKYENIACDLTGLKSGTYYAKAYVVKARTRPTFEYGTDPDTVVKFTVKVVRKGSSIGNVHAVMYGYENTYRGPAIYWFSVPGATGYSVYRYQNGEYQKVKNVAAASGVVNSWIDTSFASKRATNSYRVVAYNKSGKTPLSANKVVANYIPAPVITKNMGYADKYVLLQWKSISPYAQYTVYICTDTTDWKELGTTSDTKYIDGSAKSNNTRYYYAVIASLDNMVSGNNPKNAELVFLKAPKLNKITYPEEGQNTVSWGAVTGAEGYRVYRRESRTTAWTKLGDTAAGVLSYTDATAEAGKYYDYTVRAFQGTSFGCYSEKGQLAANLASPAITEIKRDEAGLPILSWEKLNNQCFYEVYRKTEGTDWTRLGTTSDGVWKDETAASAGIQEYTYTVRACYLTNQSDIDQTGRTFTYYPPITDVQYSAQTDGVHLNWTAPALAEKFRISRKTADGEFSVLGECTEASFMDATAEAGVAYTYEILWGTASGWTELMPTYQAVTVNTAQPVVPASTVFYKCDAAYYRLTFAEAYWHMPYRVYEKVDGKWVLSYANNMYDEFVPIFPNDKYGVREFAVSITYADGSISALPADGFRYEFLEPVKNLQGAYAEKQITLTWDANAQAQKYNIYRNDKLLTTVTELTYLDTDIKDGGTYRYRVSAAKDDIESRYGEAVTVRYLQIPAPKASAAYGGVNVTWSYSDTVSAFRIYRKEVGGEWTEIKTIARTSNSKYSYLDTTAVSGKHYSYMVRAVVGSIISDLPVSTPEVDYVAAPVLKKISNVGAGVNLQWGAVENATSYLVYRKAPGGKWAKIYTTTKTSYTDKTVKSGGNYIYTVRAIVGGIGSWYNTKGLASRFLNAPKLVSAKSGSKGITLTYGAVTGAKSYKIYRRVGTGGWKVIATVSGGAKPVYVDKTAKKGTTYTYTVRAFSGSYSSSYYSGIKCKRQPKRITV